MGSARTFYYYYNDYKGGQTMNNNEYVVRVNQYNTIIVDVAGSQRLGSESRKMRLIANAIIAACDYIENPKGFEPIRIPIMG